MPVICWGPLAKSAQDSTTIAEYIESKILSHNVNPQSHGLDGYAVFNHRSDSNLDHPDYCVASVKIVDLAVTTAKIKDLAVTTAKIKDLAVDAAKIKDLAVDTAKIKDLAVDTIKIKDAAVTDVKGALDRSVIMFSFESIDAWDQVVVGTGTVDLEGGSVEINTGVNINSRMALWLEASTEGWGVLFANNPRFAINAVFHYATNQEIYFISGDVGEDGFGFMVEDGTLYAVSYKATARSRVELSGEFEDNVWHRYKAIYTSGSKIEYFIDNVLKHTQTTNLPIEPETLLLIQLRIDNTIAQQRIANFGSLIFDQDI